MLKLIEGHLIEVLIGGGLIAIIGGLILLYLTTQMAAYRAIEDSFERYFGDGDIPQGKKSANQNDVKELKNELDNIKQELLEIKKLEKAIGRKLVEDNEK